MSEPIEYQIVRNLQSALQAISVAEGYHHDVAALAVKLDPNHDVDTLVGDTKLRPFVVLEVQPDKFQYSEHGGSLLVVMPFLVHGVQDTDPTVDESGLNTYFRLCADVEQAIAIDVTRGGLAHETVIRQRELHGINGREVWALVRGEVRVRRTYGRPNG